MKQSGVFIQSFGNYTLVNLTKKLILLPYFLAIFMTACGNGNNNSNGDGTNYYSASSATYYQIERQNNESLVLNIITNRGNNINNIPLAPTINGYTFSATIYGSFGTGHVVLKNDLMGISFAGNGSSSLALADFATTIANTNTEQIPDGTYTTICDRNNISACTIVVANNKISITEYSTAGVPTKLCSNQPLVSPTHSINQFLFSFSCTVQGGTYIGTWYIMPLVINHETALMINEYDTNISIPNSVTNEIAFLQNTFFPSGTYYYVYNGINNVKSGISPATFSNNSLINPVVGTCSGASCALISNQYFTNADTMGNIMIGFDYYSVNGTINYNLVGSTQMNLFVDSFSGIYF